VRSSVAQAQAPGRGPADRHGHAGAFDLNADRAKRLVAGRNCHWDELDFGNCACAGRNNAGAEADVSL